MALKLICVLQLALVVVQAFRLDSSITPRIRYEPVRETAKIHAQSKITNGNHATRGMFPYQAAIFIDNRAFCGGSLLNEKWVLTAAHCAKDAGSFDIYLGKNQLDVVEDQSVKATTSTYIVHEDYGSHNDIALIELPPGLTYSEWVQPVKLVSRADAYNSFESQTARVSGWGGISDTGGTSQILNYIDVSVISNSECQQTYGTETIIDSILCTSVVNAQGTCGGDSGGPLVIYNSPTDAYEIGIVSFVATSGCESGAPDGYVRVGYYLDWIQSKTGMSIP